MLVARLFYYPMIVLWLIGPMVKAVYSVAVGSLQGTPNYVQISLSLLHANNKDLGLVGCLKEILHVRLIKESIFFQYELSHRCPDI